MTAPVFANKGTALNGSTISQTAYGNGLWVAVGGAGRLAYTADNWTTKEVYVASPFTTAQTIHALAYGDGAWVIAGVAGVCASSTTAASGSWTTRTSGFDTSTILGVGHGNGVWILVGTSGKVARSTDLAAGFTIVSLPGSPTTQLNAVRYADGVWVIVGNTGSIWTSDDDGETWTARTSGFGTTHIKAVAHTAGTWVVVGNVNKIGHSANGTSWTQILGAHRGWDINGVAGGLNQFASVGNGGRYGYSTNGQLWDEEPDIGGLTTIQHAAYGDSLMSISYGTSVWTATVETLTATPTADIDVPVDVTVSGAAATMPQATILAAVAIITGAVAIATITADVSIEADARGRVGTMNLLDGLETYLPLDSFTLAGTLKRPTPDAHGEYAAFGYAVGGSDMPELNPTPLVSGSARFCLPDVAQSECSLRQVTVEAFPSIGEGDFSVSLWHYRTAKQSGDTSHPLIHNREDRPLSNGNFVRLYIRPIDGEYRLDLTLAGTTTLFSQGTQVLPGNEWVHYAIVRRNNEVRVFVNGVVDIDVTPPAGALGVAGATWQFGRWSQTSPSFSTTTWGWMDEIGIWLRALYDDEVDRLYASGAGIGYPFDTIADIAADVGVLTASRGLFDYRDVFSAQSPWRFRATVTGAPDSLSDIDVPISSWQATLNLGDSASFLQIVVPALPELISSIAARPNGMIVLRSEKTTPTEVSFIEEIARTPIGNMMLSRGASNASIVLNGYTNDIITGEGVRVLRNVMTESVFSGQRRMRAQFDPLVRPGVTVQFEATTMPAQWVSYYATGAGQAYMEIGERDNG